MVKGVSRYAKSSNFNAHHLSQKLIAIFALFRRGPRRRCRISIVPLWYTRKVSTYFLLPIFCKTNRITTTNVSVRQRQTRGGGVCKRHENSAQPQPQFSFLCTFAFFLLGQHHRPRRGSQNARRAHLTKSHRYIPEKVRHETPPRHVALEAAREGDEGARPRGL